MTYAYRALNHMAASPKRSVGGNAPRYRPRGANRPARRIVGRRASHARRRDEENHIGLESMARGAPRHGWRQQRQLPRHTFSPAGR